MGVGVCVCVCVCVDVCVCVYDVHGLSACRYDACVCVGGMGCV